MKQYNLRLQQICATNKIEYRTRSCILQDVPNAEKLLHSDPVHPDDVKLVSQNLSLFYCA